MADRTESLTARSKRRRGRCVVLGITGGVASGKSSVAGMFEERGASRVSADAIARELLAPGSDMTRLALAEFGSGIRAADAAEAIDRKALAKLIYADGSARRRLGELMHPAIRERMRQQIERHWASGSRLIVAEIPLLYENGLEAMVDAVLVAECSETSQVARLTARQPWLSAGEALRQIRSQLPLAQKAARAQYVLSTEQDWDQVEQRVGELFRRLASAEA